jgi:hypothetical protein
MRSARPILPIGAGSTEKKEDTSLFPFGVLPNVDSTLTPGSHLKLISSGLVFMLN